MASYTAKFIAFICERTRPENFPKQVFSVGTYRADNNMQLAELINNEMAIIIQNQGMMISTEPEQVVDLNNVLTNLKTRIFVPMHMIAYIRTDLQPMTSLPLSVDTGVLTADGKRVMEYQNVDGEVIKPS